MVKALLEKALAQSSCVVFPAADQADIAEVNQQLVALGFASLPADFAAFLQICNGLSYDGLEILGTKPHPRPEKQYTFTGLVEANRIFADYGYFADKVIIGCMSEHFMVYDAGNKLFAVTDRINLCSQIEFSNFRDFLTMLLHYCDIDA